MKEKIGYRTYVCLVLLLVALPVPAQEKDKVVILSPRVGAVIDSTERSRFQVLPAVRDFVKAVIFQTPSGIYYVQITVLDSGGKERVIRLYYPEEYLQRTAEQIEHFEELNAGTYQMGQQPATLRVVEADRVFAGPRSEGARVILLLNSGQQIHGELLSVRDSALVISTIEDIHEKELASQTASIHVIKNQEILHVTIKGKSKVLKGMVQGFLIGAGAGALLGLATYQPCPPKSFICLDFGPGVAAAGGAILLGGAGFLIGTIAGIASSRGDKVIEPLPGRDLSLLKPYARFPLEEPEFLGKIK